MFENLVSNAGDYPSPCISVDFTPLCDVSVLCLQCLFMTKYLIFVLVMFTICTFKSPKTYALLVTVFFSIVKQVVVQ